MIFGVFREGRKFERNKRSMIVLWYSENVFKYMKKLIYNIMDYLISVNFEFNERFNSLN